MQQSILERTQRQRMETQQAELVRMKSGMDKSMEAWQMLQQLWIRVHNLEQFDLKKYVNNFLNGAQVLYKGEDPFSSSVARLLDKEDLKHIKFLPQLIDYVKNHVATRDEFTSFSAYEKEKRYQQMVGLQGPPGPPGKDAAPGKDGKNGTNGKDGKNGQSDTKIIVRIAEQAVKDFQERTPLQNLHTPFQVGSVVVDETNMADGRVLEYNQKRNCLEYVDPPKAIKEIYTRDMGAYYGSGSSAPALEVRDVTSDFTILIQDHVIHIDASNGNIIGTFFPSKNGFRRPYVLKRIDSSDNTVTIVTDNDNELIEFNPTDQLPNQGSSRSYYPHNGHIYLLSA